LPKCDNVAHRGFSAEYPENTLLAIRKAIDAGATGCEFDVYGASDGTVVLMHDKTIDRTTNGTGKVTQQSVADLKKLDAGSWKDSKFAREKVPTLEEALRLLRGSNCQPVIEIKMEGISEAVIETIRDLQMTDEVAVIAFSQYVVREIRRLEPKITCAWLSSEELTGSTSERAAWIVRHARACHARIVDLNYKMLSPELVSELEHAKLDVWTWTVDDPKIMHDLKQWGLRSLTTNRPDLFPTDEFPTD
jgi:glycerophosphoryl diester phosphodiesterase